MGFSRSRGRCQDASMAAIRNPGYSARHGDDLEIHGMTIWQIPEEWFAPLALMFIALAVAVPVLLVTLVVLRLRLQKAVIRANANELSETALRDLLSSAPEGFFAWMADGRIMCSRRMAILLELVHGVDSTFADVIAAFAPDDARQLDALLTAMTSQGIGFDAVLQLADSPRQVGLHGLRITTESGIWLADILWASDVTETARAMSSLDSRLQTIAAHAANFKGVLDCLPMPVWLRGEDLSLQSANQAYALAVEAQSSDEVVGHQIELASEDTVREARALAASARAARAPRSRRFHLVLGGQRRLVSLTESPFALGDHLMTAGYIQDQTPLEELEAQIERHISVQREVLEQLATAIAIFSTDTRLSFHNTAFARLWRLDPDWLVGLPNYGEVLDLLRERRILPEVVEYRAYKEDEMRLFTSLLHPVETLMHLPDGRTLRRVVSPHPHGGLILTYEDVTDTLALERSFNTMMAVQRETLDHLHEGLVVVGGDGRIKLFNPAFAGMWGLSAELLASEPHGADLVDHLRDYFHRGQDWPALRDRLRALFTERRVTSARLERNDGTILDCASVPLPDGAMLLTWLDVTDTQRKERALRDRNEVLAADDSLKSQVIATASTEVKKPLDSIISATQTLLKADHQSLPQEHRAGIEGIWRSVTILESLVGDILDLVAVDAGQLTLELNTVDIIPLLISVMALVRERARESRVHMDLDCPTDIGWIVADERRLKQVLFTLLNDLIASTRAGEHIPIKVSRQGRDMCFTVQASKAESDDAHPEYSFGLRRALMQRIVQMHGGDIEVNDHQDNLTRVTIRVPTGLASRM